MKMSSEEIRKTDKGIGIDNIHYIGGQLLQLSSDDNLPALFY